MEGIVTLVILFFIINSVMRMIKKAQPRKKPPTQAEIEATKPRPVPKPAAKKEDFRFPSPKPKAAPVVQEGRNPAEQLSTYTPIAPSKELQNRFSDFQGSLSAPATEGIGYQTGVYDDAATPYDTDPNDRIKVLPETLTSDTLVQAIVMNEILKRPGVRR